MTLPIFYVFFLLSCGLGKTEHIVKMLV